MGVSRTASRSPLNTWQPDHIYADLEQTCHLTCQNEHEQNSCTLPAEHLTARSRLCRFRANMPLKHANMSVSRTAARSPPWQPDHVYEGLEQTCHLNVPTWAWAEQLHTPCPDSQITRTAIWRDWVAQHNKVTHTGYTIKSRTAATQIATPKPDLDAQAKNDDYEALLKRNFKRKIISAKMTKKSATKRHSQLSCCHDISQLQNTLVLRTQP